MMPATDPPPPVLARLQRVALLVGVAGVALSVLGALIQPEQFFRSYLAAYLFWLGLAVGCLPILMLDHLAGGGWGAVIQRFLEAATRTLPLMALLFIPVAVGIPSLYEWSHADAVAADPLLQYKQPYLNVPFFLLRAVVYFATWLLLMYFLNRWARARDASGDPALSLRLRRLGALGLAPFTLTVTFAAFDWIMSLEPHWYSTIYGAMVAIGQIVGAFAFIIAMLVLLAPFRPLSAVTSPKILNDLGSLQFSFVMIWAYLAFSQFMLIWYGNLPEETPWYIRRLSGGWQWVAIAILVFHFVLPFVLLLSTDVKRSARLLGGVALLLVVIRFVDTYWLVAPAFHGTGLAVHWLDLVTVLGVGGLWLAFYTWQLRRWPLLPLHDPELVRALAPEHA